MLTEAAPCRIGFFRNSRRGSGWHTVAGTGPIGSAPRLQIGFVLHNRIPPTRPSPRYPSPPKFGFVSHNRLFVESALDLIEGWASSLDSFRIGFVSHDCPMASVSRRTGNRVRFAQLAWQGRGRATRARRANWVRFAHLPFVPRPSGPVPPGTAGNWVRFARFDARRRYPASRPASISGHQVPNWVCFARYASDWKGGIMEYWNVGHLGSPEIGFVLHDSSPCQRSVPNPQSAMLSPPAATGGRNREIGFVLRI
jgi:hypothetical protein